MVVALAAVACIVGLFRGKTVVVALAAFAFAGAVIPLVSAPRTVARRGQPIAAHNSGLLERTRSRATASIDSVFKADAPMARALLVADQHEISPEMRQRYSRAGLIHMLSISGLHVAIIASSIVLLLQLARLPPAAASVTSLTVIAAYVAVIGAPAPALRSAVMLGTVIMSRMSQRPISPWAALALGAFVPLVNPRVVTELGYQLSVVGIAGLIASAALSRRMVARRLSGVRHAIVRDILASSFATVVSSPLIAWYFGTVSLIAPLANLAAGPVIAILQPMLFLALVLVPIPWASSFVADAAHPLLALFDTIAAVAAGIPHASIAVVPTLITAVAAGCAVVAVIAACLCRYPIRPLIAATGAFVVIAWSPAVRFGNDGSMEMHVLDVGQGDAVLIRTDRGRWILFDAGGVWKTGDAGRSVIVPYIMRRGGPLVALILSHAHADHAGGVPTILRALRPRQFWDAAFVQGSEIYDRSLRAAREAGVSWKRVHPNDSLTVDGVDILFLAPDSAWTAALTDPNDASTVALVRFGTSRFLLVGDAEQAEEEWLLANARSELRADVLKVGHHGSATSSGEAFLAAVNPSLAVISVGRDNDYGHPSNDVLAALGRVGAEVARTDRNGTVVVRTDGHNITVELSGEQWAISNGSRKD